MINDNRMSIIMKAQQDGECGKPMVEIPPIKMVMTWGWSIVGFTQCTIFIFIYQNNIDVDIQ